MANNNGGGNSRKIGRNAKDCSRYALEGKLVKNKKRAAVRHAKRMALAASKAAFRKAHNGMSRAQYEEAMKAAPRWQRAESEQVL